MIIINRTINIYQNYYLQMKGIVLRNINTELICFKVSFISIYF